jgi:NTP pyrophosphatase (non-canonical NTP hydrolase)
MKDEDKTKEQLIQELVELRKQLAKMGWQAPKTEEVSPEYAMSTSSEEVNEHVDEVQKRSEEVLSSERREDIWAILLAVIIFLLSVIWPEPIYHFFKKTLFFF